MKRFEPNTLAIHAESRDHGMSIGFAIIQYDDHGMRYVVRTEKMDALGDGRMKPHHEVQISRKEATKLMNDLWKSGIRPSKDLFGVAFEDPLLIEAQNGKTNPIK